MKSLLLIAALILVAVARPPKWHQLKGYTFQQYAKDFGKTYSSAEYAQREQLFNSHLKAVQEHNAKGLSYKKGVNHMSDWTEKEFLSTNGAKVHTKSVSSNVMPYKRTGGMLPKSVDWRNHLPSVLTAVKDQGMCGSCWAHGATEQMETYWAIATGELFVFSQQQVTACAPNPDDCGGFGGCQGSTAELAFDYVMKAGLTQEWQYPYTAYTGTTGTCKGITQSLINVTGVVKLNTNDQDAVLEALAQVGPLAVNVDASSWSDYETGIFTGCDYAKNISIDHVVQLVGYGTDTELNMDYWIVRNSWSPSYGESGFIRVQRTSTPACGWDVDPQDGTGCNGGPPQLWVCGMCGIVFDTSYPKVSA